ncbi:MAG: hypothetical protein C5B58_02835 [Acidobacteria bacterium]|nr:MAG: hypothetical protein C5B58_02835 [Acidobacteriota bacterium]
MSANRLVTGRLEVTSAFLAVRNNDGRKGLITIARGSIVEVTGAFDENDMVAITFDGDLLLAFGRDVEERSRVIED